MSQVAVDPKKTAALLGTQVGMQAFLVNAGNVFSSFWLFILGQSSQSSLLDS